MFAHQHFGAPGFLSDDRFIDPVMIVVPAADVAMLEGDDVAARRHRDVMADPDHFAEHAVARGGQQGVVEVTVDSAIDRQITGFK
jgi:hypothetical protein